VADAFNYARSRSTAEKLIAKFGMAGVIRRQTNTGPAYDPVVIDTDYPCTLVVLEYEDARIDGALIRQSDKLIYVSTKGLTITPTEADRVIAHGDTFAIESIKPLSPAGLTVFWELQARK
jgi:hypothetical protein